jgi:hypothetical protein
LYRGAGAGGSRAAELVGGLLLRDGAIAAAGCR